MSDRPAWTSNATPEQIAARLRAARKVVVLTHAKPDGDAVGASLALTRALNLAAGKDVAQAYYFGPLPPWLRDLVGQTPATLIEQGSMPNSDADAVAIVDTGSWMQLDPMRSFLAGRAASTCLIDHHVQGDADIAEQRCIETSAAAASQPVTQICCALLGNIRPEALPTAVAEPLYLGLATDTGWFRHSNVTHAVMDLAGKLLDARADHIRLYRVTEQQDSPGRVRLLARALSTLDMRLNDRLALMHLRLEDFAQSGAAPGESGGFTDHTQAIASVTVSAMFTQTRPDTPGGPPIIKISLRSKDGPAGVDVNTVARSLGGGGHVRAAGAKTTLPLDQAKDTITKLVAEQLNPRTNA